MDLFNVLFEIYLGYNIFLCEDSGMRYCTFHGIIPEKKEFLEFHHLRTHFQMCLADVRL